MNTPGLMTSLSIVKAVGVVGPCNGLVCLADDSERYHSKYNFILWNPSVRKFLKLPAPPNATYFTHNVGFGFDAKTNDYKVVSFVTSGGISQMGDSPLKFQVYSLVTADWRMVTTCLP